MLFSKDKKLKKELLVKEIRLNKKNILDGPNNAGYCLGHLNCVHSWVMLLGQVVWMC